ncbi:MAG: 8-oxoguanine deaminase [Clostridiales bacterium]|jgi:cytosine/adenosine deaminase-related metal-dependent hydrolase|nr:8-oxoguanine deaminase [Clostridiales bacterium]MDN5281267.1 8-oxoguanine deaminase [Candidatus Ozemobacter sp.]
MNLFIKNARYFWAGGDAEVLQNVSILVKNSEIEAIGSETELAPLAGDARNIDASELLIMPGMINTHHHFYQTLTRNFPCVQDAKLFTWLVNLYPLWAQITEEDFHLSTTVASLELLMSGCTTAVDHSYMVPTGASNLYYKQIEAAKKTGMRFHLCRGSMSRSKKDGGLPPDSVVQTEDVIMKETDELVTKVHEGEKGGMVRIIIAPCSPFSVTKELMIEAKKYANRKGLKAHTHLAETKDEEQFCIKEFGVRPVKLMEDLGWMDENSFYAHCVHFNQEEIEIMGKAQGGVAHCPTSNMRLASGIAPIVEMLKANVPVSLAVDGSASNDCSNMMLEVRNCMLLQRVLKTANCITARDALKIATQGGAKVIGRDDVGYLDKGYEADLIGFRLDSLRQAGSSTDPLAALVFCAVDKVDLSVVHGEVLIENGDFTRFSKDELNEIITRQNERSQAIYSHYKNK